MTWSALQPFGSRQSRRPVCHACTPTGRIWCAGQAGVPRPTTAAANAAQTVRTQRFPSHPARTPAPAPGALSTLSPLRLVALRSLQSAAFQSWFFFIAGYSWRSSRWPLDTRTRRGRCEDSDKAAIGTWKTAWKNFRGESGSQKADRTLIGIADCASDWAVGHGQREDSPVPSCAILRRRQQ